MALEVERRVSPESGTALPGLGFSNSIAQRAAVSPLSLAWLVSLWWRQWRPYRFRSDLRTDRFERQNAARQWKPVAIDYAVELSEQRSVFFFGKVKVHDLQMRRLTNCYESAQQRPTAARRRSA